MNGTGQQYPWTFAELDAMPTLAKGQSQELKIDGATERVWIEPTAADYGIPNIYIERLIDGRWVETDKYYG